MFSSIYNCGRPIKSYRQVTTLGYSYENAKVIEVVEDNLSPDGVRVGYQMLKVQLTSGEYKGEIVNATSAEGNLFGAVCKKGDSVVVHMSVSGDSKNVSAYMCYRWKEWR